MTGGKDIYRAPGHLDCNLFGARTWIDNDNILDIALDCGFDNPSYFTRSFKQQFSMTPRAYRRGTPAIGSPLAS